MKKILLILLVFLAVVLISGCVQRAADQKIQEESLPADAGSEETEIQQGLGDLEEFDDLIAGDEILSDLEELENLPLE